jgi:hypothetical protein
MRQKSLISLFVAAAAGLALVPPASAGVILNSAGQFDRSISARDPIGQSFTAEDPLLGKIAFAFSDINPGFPNDPVTMTLYTGTGFGGSVVKAVTQTLPDPLPSTAAAPQFIDFDFTGAALTVGNIYTVAVTTSSSPKIAVVYDSQDHYNGGIYIDAVDGQQPTFELNFRVTPGVPEPATLLPSLAGAALLSTRRARYHRYR